MIKQPNKMDLKGMAVYIGAIFLGDINASLQAVGLLANLCYIAYQFRILKKKTEADEQKNEGEGE